MSNQDIQILTKDEIKEQAPLVLAQEPTRNVSNRYTFINTETVIDDMAKLGWLPTQVGQRKTRNPDTPFSPHMVKFSNPDLRIVNDAGDASFPQIILNNSHDGLGKFKFMAGIFRLVCSNGLVIATEKFGQMKIAHKGYDFAEVREIVRTRTEALPEQIQIMNDMKNHMLTREEQRELAIRGLFLRSQVPADKENQFRGLIDTVTLEEILTPVRDQDKGNDLWNTFQIVQEKMVKGGFHTQLGFDTKVRKVKEIRSFLTDMDLNKKLFGEARNMLVEA